MLHTISTSIYIKTTESIRSFIHNERGVTAVEYAIIAVAMSGIALTFVNQSGVKSAISNMATTISNNLTNAQN
ncbi:Flp family type IVb pilin [Vibrio sp. JC009]|uniref:Flp family type IVb pilin n=1 Tax=Vibrio sp. JC009 TaxID=2912314 RepID=UPI0023AF47B2|nr:Flp family type IVb pilin [Vibrio sp. JC009]WED24564.1 Flp family type IVb pilin [Vibrio sp. JC009]